MIKASLDQFLAQTLIAALRIDADPANSPSVDGKEFFGKGGGADNICFVMRDNKTWSAKVGGEHCLNIIMGQQLVFLTIHSGEEVFEGTGVCFF